MQQETTLSRTVCVIALLIMGGSAMVGCGELGQFPCGSACYDQGGQSRIPDLVTRRSTGCPDCHAAGWTTYPPFGGGAGFMRGNGQRYVRGYSTDGRSASSTSFA